MHVALQTEESHLLRQKGQELQRLDGMQCVGGTERLLQKREEGILCRYGMDAVFCSALKDDDGTERHGNVIAEMVLAVPGGAIDLGLCSFGYANERFVVVHHHCALAEELAP